MNRYSNRIPWPLATNRLSELLARKRIAGTRLLDLSVSNPTLAKAYPHARIQHAMSGAAAFTYLPDPFGLHSTRTSIAHYYQKRGYAVAPSRIALTASTSEGYSLLFKLLCNPGDEILTPTPSYPLFEYLASAEGVRASPYRLAYDGSWFVDFTSLEQAITPHSRAIIVVNPNNPTGSFLKIQEFERLCGIAGKHNLPILSDEVFMDFAFAPDERRLQTLVDQSGILSFSLNGLSKAAGMPQMKLAWIVVNGPETEQQLALERLEILLDTYLSVNTPAQLVFESLLEIGEQIRSDLSKRILYNLEQAVELLCDSPAHVLHTEGGWSAILQLPSTLADEEWALRILEEEDVILQPGFFFDLSAGTFVVVSLITEPEIFRGGMQRLRSLVERLTRG